jgi:hypothetical protein
MIYWKQIEDFDSACKMVALMSWPEYEYILHMPKLEVIERFGDKGKLLKSACTHVCNLRKLGESARGKFLSKLPEFKIRMKGEMIEYYIKGKKICGYPRKGLPKGFICTKPAGYGTKHVGYGNCFMHESLLTPSERKEFWLKLKKTHENVPLLKDLVVRSEKIEEVAINTMDADLSYLELARQMIMKRVEDTGGVAGRAESADLAYVSEVMAKVKALKVKTQAMNWIPPEQVIAIILQVIDAVTKNESSDVRRRIAERAKDIGTILVPRIEGGNPEIQDMNRDPELRKALVRAGEYVEKDASFADIPETTGYSIGTPQAPKPKILPNYRKNHPLMKNESKNSSSNP